MVKYLQRYPPKIKKCIKTLNQFITVNKNYKIETLRGIAIILVVLGHVIGSKNDGGLRVADDSFLRYVYYTFQYLRMPLFTVISGWVYSLYPVKVGMSSTFIKKKIRRILVPMLIVGGLFYILQSIVPNTNASGSLRDIWTLVVLPYTFYWYLQSLFLVFVLVGLLDSIKKINQFQQWLFFTTFTIAILFLRDVFIPEEVPNVFGFKGAIYLLPFFSIGLGVQRFKKELSNHVFLKAIAVIVILGLVFQQLAWFKLVSYTFTEKDMLGWTIGLLASFLFLHNPLESKRLVHIGKYAYTIFLFHGFGTAGGRILAGLVGIQETGVVLLISLKLGLFSPILVEKIATKSSLLRFLLLGKSLQKKVIKNTHQPVNPIV